MNIDSNYDYYLNVVSETPDYIEMEGVGYTGHFNIEDYDELVTRAELRQRPGFEDDDTVSNVHFGNHVAGHLQSFIKKVKAGKGVELDELTKMYLDTYKQGYSINPVLKGTNAVYRNGKLYYKKPLSAKDNGIKVKHYYALVRIFQLFMENNKIVIDISPENSDYNKLVKFISSQMNQKQMLECIRTLQAGYKFPNYEDPIFMKNLKELRKRKYYKKD